VEISAPIQEKPMEASQEKTPAAVPETSEQTVSGPTAKELAAAEEQNAARLRKQIEAQQAEPPHPAVPTADLAARGYDALHDAFKRHNENTARKKEYVPPPRTDRQMSLLQEELEAGARAVARNKAQQAATKPVKPDANKEGFTTPVFRDGTIVPDPIMKGYKGFDKPSDAV
jgi:uncharacterized membrane-anchored protein